MDPAGNSGLRSITTLSGRVLTFAGSEDDAYFRGLEAFHNASPQFEAYIRRTLAADANAIDVGANIGLTAALLAVTCPNGRVHAIEASPRNARYLRENIARNGLDNCVVMETAVGNRSGTLAFQENAFGAGSHVLGGAEMAAGTKVPVAALDELFRADGRSRRIDFIKLDIEGFEPVALSGAARLIERDRCAIFMEFNSWCLQVLHEFNAFAFARALAGSFELAGIGKDGGLQAIGAADVHGFMYANIMQHGCVDDVVLRLKEGARVPPLVDMIKGADDARTYREAARLRSELAAARRARYFGLGRLGGGTEPEPCLNVPARSWKAEAARPTLFSRLRGGPASRTQAQSDSKNDHIQLLRALAIGLVLIAHLSITGTLLMYLPFTAGNPGWIGVEIFFVVSGYVVQQSFARAQYSVRSFAIRRVFRLYPVLLLFLALTVPVKLICDALVADPPALFAPSFEALTQHALAILFAYHPSAEWGVSWANRALWSLSVELRFYAALALFVLVLNLLLPTRALHGRRILLAAGTVYATALTARLLAGFGVRFPLGDALIHPMYDFIALGVIVATLPATTTEAIARLTRPLAPLLLPAALLAAMTIVEPNHALASGQVGFNLIMVAAGWLFTLLLIACTSPARIPLSGPVRAFANIVGDRSYAIFLLHLPVFNVAWAIGQYLGWGDGYWQWPLFQLALAVVILVPLVEVAHRAIELPMIAAGKSLTRRSAELIMRLRAQRPAALPPVPRTSLEPAE